MAEIGGNPNRIIPVWRDFVGGQNGRPVRGIGEPIWPGRGRAEVVECQLHEALLNIAFADDEGFRLMCPYDASRLEPPVVREALRSHPLVSCEDGLHGRAGRIAGTRCWRRSTGRSRRRPRPPRRSRSSATGSSDVRHTVARAADRAGLGRERAHDLVLAVNELAGNSTRHGSGRGVLRVWRDDEMLVCEIRDRGRITDPLVGRRRPEPESEGGWGLWIVNQVCDLVQLRSGSDGTVVRAHMRTAA